jgi:predicted amidohydrolase
LTRNGHLLSRIGIAGLQLDLRTGDNREYILHEVAAVKQRLPWVDMVVLPELCAYGTDPRAAERLNGPAERDFRKVARDQHVWLIPGSLFQQDGDGIFNTTPVIDPSGTIVARYRKLFPFRPYEEGVGAGDSFCVFTVPGVGVFGVSICYDIWFPEVARTLAWMGAQVILTPSLTNTIDRDVELAHVRSSAAANQCYAINVNTGGPLGFGRSIACGPGGEVLHQSGEGREVFAVELDLEHVTRVRERGWHGLGQVLKSFRDASVEFPPYQPGRRSFVLDSLGPLQKPTSTTAQD